MLCILSELSALAGPGFTYGDSNHGSEKKRKNPIQLIQRLEMSYRPGSYRVIFLHLSSNRRTRDLKWQPD